MPIDIPMGKGPSPGFVGFKFNLNKRLGGDVRLVFRQKEFYFSRFATDSVRNLVKSLILCILQFHICKAGIIIVKLFFFQVLHQEKVKTFQSFS